MSITAEVLVAGVVNPERYRRLVVVGYIERLNHANRYARHTCLFADCHLVGVVEDRANSVNAIVITRPNTKGKCPDADDGDQSDQEDPLHGPGGTCDGSQPDAPPLLNGHGAAEAGLLHAEFDGIWLADPGQRL